MSHTPRHLPTETVIHKQGFLDSFDADSVVNWLAQNGKNVVYVLLGLLALFILVYRLSSSNATKSEKDYLQAASDFASFIHAKNPSDSAASQETYKRLTALIDSHPELRSAYDGAIGQTLLNRGEVVESKPFIINTLKRTQAESLMAYNKYAATSLLISEAQYKEALEQSEALQQTMLKDLSQGANSERAFSEVLFAFNLLRIAMLHQQLENKNEELRSWQEWKAYAGLDKASKQSTGISPLAFRAIIQQLATGKIALPDYIAYREKVLQ